MNYANFYKWGDQFKNGNISDDSGYLCLVEVPVDSV